MWLVLFAVCFSTESSASLIQKFDSLATAGISKIVPIGNKCLGDLGCFSNGPPFFDALNRPISLLPTDNLTTKFLLFTRESPNKPMVLILTDESISAADIKETLPTKIIIHGYDVALDENDVRFAIKEELLKNGSFNVIIVDWTDLNQFPYPQAIANGRAVGAQIAKLIKILERDRSIKPEDVHIIGHSLGAHVAGWAGERVENLGRISGLDPAGPFFQNAPPEVRLDPSDAFFVDVIHTNGGSAFPCGLGISQPIGHLDFYPNGGSHQPGCVLNINIEEALFGDDLVKLFANSCDHSRAYLYFKDSINTCMFTSINCYNYKEFQSGKCVKRNDIDFESMGYHAVKENKTDLKYYLKTTAESPFCLSNDTYFS